MSGKIVQLRKAKKYRNATSRANGRRGNDAYRTREHLTEAEMDKLLAALKRNRHGHRDWPVGLIIYRHGLRVSEACDLRWDDIDLPKRTIIVRRLKGSTDSVHYLERDEVNGLKLLQRQQQADGVKGLTCSSMRRGQPFGRMGIGRMIERAGEAAGLPFPVHVHMLRHSTGYALLGCWAYDAGLTVCFSDAAQRHVATGLSRLVAAKLFGRLCRRVLAGFKRPPIGHDDSRRSALPNPCRRNQHVPYDRSTASEWGTVGGRRRRHTTDALISEGIARRASRGRDLQSRSSPIIRAAGSSGVSAQPPTPSHSLRSATRAGGATHGVRLFLLPPSTSFDLALITL